MDLGLDARLDDHLKCRTCLSPDATADFIQLKGWKAKMFKDVIGVDLTIDGDKSKSVMCQSCFGKLENFHDFKERGIRADREYFEIQRQLAATQGRSNEPAQAADEFEPPEAAAIEPYSPSRVMHEPPVEFVLILPRATSDQSKDVIDIDRKWVESVQLTKFDAEWQSESTPFQSFLTCKHCRLVVKRKGNLIRHLETCSKIITARFECDNCKERFRHKSKIDEHMLKHSSVRKFRCIECGNGYKRKDGLIKHKKTHDKPITCEICQKKFAENKSLKLHQMNHRHGIHATYPEETFDCEKCDKTFSSPKYLKQHQKQVHEENEAKCEICDKILKNRTYLLKHIQNHSKIKCSICHRKISKYSMFSHVRSHSRHFECDLCNQSCNTKDNLKQHIERVHLLKKLVKDFECHPDFSDFELLEKLQLTHGSSATSADKKFRCDKCKKAFANPNTLNKHKRNVHPDKLLDCHVCKKAFKTKGHLKQHKARVHSKCQSM